jgi:PTH1 family peptidyl-tRNA hydrolase
MKLIVGLGNPGTEYDKTRHNAGFLVVDELAMRYAGGGVPRSRFGGATIDAILNGEKCVLLKPLKYMNLSGQSVAEAVRFFKLDPKQDLIVALDDIALPVGMIRLRAGGGTAGHNGLKDIDRLLGGEQYARCRVGVGKTPAMMNQADWVLSRFHESERADVDRSVKDAADAIACFVVGGIAEAMNRYNKRLTPDDAKPKKTHPAENPTQNTGPGRDSAGPDAKDDIHPGWTGNEGPKGPRRAT